MVKNPLDNAEDIRDKGLIPGSVRSLRAGQGNPLSILAWRIPLDRKAWHVIVHIVEKTWTRFTRRARARAPGHPARPLGAAPLVFPSASRSLFSHLPVPRPRRLIQCLVINLAFQNGQRAG